MDSHQLTRPVITKTKSRSGLSFVPHTCGQRLVLLPLICRRNKTTKTQSDNKRCRESGSARYRIPPGLSGRRFNSWRAPAGCARTSTCAAKEAVQRNIHRRRSRQSVGLTQERPLSRVHRPASKNTEKSVGESQLYGTA